MFQLQAQKNSKTRGNDTMADIRISLMTNGPSPGTYQSVETRTLKGHTWKADECSIEILLLEFHINTLKMEDPVCSL